MGDAQRPGSAKAGLLLRRARAAVRTNPFLRGALTDPGMIAAADGVLSTMRERGVVPTALNALAHLTDAGTPEDRAAILAAIVERRLQEIQAQAR